MQGRGGGALSRGRVSRRGATAARRSSRAGRPPRGLFLYRPSCGRC